MLGLSRLGYALSVNRQIPSAFGSLHRTRATPVGIIAFGAVTAIALLIPADLEFLAAICAFGATIAFTIVGLVGRSGCARRSRPATGRTRCRSTCACAAGSCRSRPCCASCSRSSRSSRCWSSTAPRAGSACCGWSAGISLYLGYRLSQGKDVFKRVTVPEAALTRRAAEAEFGSILVPVLGTPLDDDIMQTAGRLAAEENATRTTRAR